MPAFRPASVLLLAALLPAARAQSLPETGQLDDGKVLQARYGKAAASAPAAGLPSASGAAQQPAPAPADIDFKAGIEDAVTGVQVETRETKDKAAVPLSFGQVFAPGDVKRGESLAGRLADGSKVPLQVDVKATHADGSLRHAVISAVLPPAGGKPQTLVLVKDKAGARPGAGAGPAALLEAGFTASVSATVDGQVYTASADRLLRQKPAVWLDGPLVTEWLVSAPLKDAKGAEHPRLSAHFAVRWYRTLGKARVDVTLENTWTWQPAPRNVGYDARVLVGGKEVFAQPGLTHLNQARWRKVFWWGEVPEVQIRHDSAYLIATRALPNYDRSVRISAKALADFEAAWNGPKTEPMGIGLALAYMPTTGARNDIGLLPAWAAAYLLGMDPRAKMVTLGTADLAGSWSVHYRDQRTGRPLSVIDYPYVSFIGQPSDALNPKTGKSELLPVCAKDACKTPYAQDLAHQPSFAYLPYLVTGDFYYLEELEFWAMFDAFSAPAGYRQNSKALLKPGQVRGQAWGLRTIAEAAYIAPDADPLKDHFRRVVDSNLDWYNATYTDNPDADKLGFLSFGYAVVYKNGTGVAPWQDDFFTAAVGHVAELGFPAAERLLAWKIRFPIGRMSAPGACWVMASMYEMVVRDTQNAPFYPTMAQAFKATHPEAAALPCASGEMAQALKLKPGEMMGFASSPIGSAAIMQPALAYAADAGGDAGMRAWTLYSRRSVKPDYGGAPQYAIVPRKAPAQEK
jgi:hypothetical protein